MTAARPTAPPHGAAPIRCRECEALLAWRWPSGYIRFVVAPVEKRPDGRVVIDCPACSKSRRI